MAQAKRNPGTGYGGFMKINQWIIQIMPIQLLQVLRTVNQLSVFYFAEQAMAFA